MATWLITGGSGFLGRPLLARLRESVGLDVVVAGRHRPEDWPADAFVPMDLDDPGGPARGVADVRPDCLIHLAGRTPPADVPAFYRANTGATVFLVEALKAAGRPCRLVVAGSAAELGPVPDRCLPVAEDYPGQPVGPYALSKWLASRYARAEAGPVEAVVARIFNPIGPGMPEGQAFGRFARLLASPGPDPIRLLVGDLVARRDFVDARDVADALIALARHGRAGRVYHVGSGRSRSIGEGLAFLVLRSGRRVEVSHASDGPPRNGPRDSRADIGRIVRETGWSPRVPFETSLADLLAVALGDQRRGPRLTLTSTALPVESARRPREGIVAVASTSRRTSR